MYRFKLNISFWEMVEEAGGLSTRSRFEEIYIERRGEMIYEDFWNAFYDASSLYELGIQSGDQIVAPIINRISFYTIMRYVSFGMSVLTFYFTFLNYRQR
jgi:hypothetical protein